MTAHYTPFYYLLTAAVQTVVGPGFLAGRLVSVFSILATSCAAGWLVRRMTGRAGAGLAAGALWLSFYPVVFWRTAHRVDAPGILFEAIGIAIYVVAQKERRPGYGAIPWLVAAWATKQVLFVGLLAVLAHRLMDRERVGVRSAATWAALAWGPILALFLFWTWWSGGGFWTATVLGTVSGAADAPWVIVSNSERFFGSPWNVGTFLTAAAAVWLGVVRFGGGTAAPAPASLPLGADAAAEVRLASERQAAFAEFIAEDGVIFPAGAIIKNGKQYWKEQKPQPIILKWERRLGWDAFREVPLPH